MDSNKTFQASTLAEWREWLVRHHRTKKVVWLVFPKKHTGLPTLSYEDSIEEALCFGWIDSIIKKIDANRYARKFTPRTDCTKWSPTNIRRVRKLVREGRMTETGLKKIDSRLLEKPSQPSQPKPGLSIPPFIREALSSDPKARANFDTWPPSQKRLAVLWIMDAKREETREKRLNEVIGLLRKNQRLGMK